MKIFAALLALAFVGAGCVSTVDGRRTAGVPFIKDSVVGYYERPVDQIAQAAKEVMTFNGTLVNESVIHSETNMVKTVQGRINKRTVWVRVEQVQPNVSAVQVQTRTSAGGSDVDLAHEVEKQIALKLVR